MKGFTLIILVVFSFFLSAYTPGDHTNPLTENPAQQVKKKKPSRLKATFPFKCNGKAMILMVKINNHERPLRFIFDSAATGIAVTRSIAEEVGLTIQNHEHATVVGGSVQTSVSLNNTIYFCDSVSISDQRISVFDEIGIDADGIIGITLSYKYIVKVNFDQEEISLYTFGVHPFDKEGETIKFTTFHNIILLPGSMDIGNRKDVKGQFALDTGAGFHLICFDDYVRKKKLLSSGFKVEEKALTMSLGQRTPIYIGKVSRFSFGNTLSVNNMPVALQVSTINVPQREYADGSIGIELLSQFNFTINLRKKMIHFTPRQKEN